MDLEESVVIDLTQFGSDDSTGYSGFYDHDEVSIVSAQFPNKRTKMEPKTSTNTSYGHLEDDLPESVAPTSAYTEMPGTSNTIMVITEGRGVASEIAYSFIDLNTTQCIVSQFADSASYSRIIYTILTTRPQLVLVPNAMAEWKSKAIVNIRRYLPWLTVAPLARALFSDAKGIRKLQELVVPAQAAPLVRIMAKKQYASAAFNAMIEHLEDNLDLTFVDGSINVKFRQMEGTMQIDPGAWRDLGLDSYAKTSGKSEPTLYSAINHTYTKMGSRLLRANILQPLTDLSTIYARQNAVLEILDSEEMFFSLSSGLPKIPDIDATITALVRQSPTPGTAKQTTQAINNVLIVKHLLLIAKSLANRFLQEPRCRLLAEIYGALSDTRVSKLLDSIHNVVREDVDMESAQISRSQRCHAVKATRAIFDKVTQEVVDLVEEYANEIQVPIRAVYKPAAGYIMTAKKTDLGSRIPEEFVNVAVKKNAVTFTTLDLASREVVPNDIDTRGRTFTIVSGPNMGGKSTYLRQIVYLVIMAQIGCLVPAKKAVFKVFDKLFVRMNNDDNIIANESTFLREMHDISYILCNYDQHSLIAIDELGRSTNTREGKAICRAICEEFLDCSTTVFLSTHFLDLPEVLEVHSNCKTIVLSQDLNKEESIINKYKAVPGSQSETMYGIQYAEKAGLPQDIIDIAKSVAKEAETID
ncbi:MutS protein msh4 [Coemansia sp. RSA 1646]|nr:MutS protein msh4 [Coemansia sp. RSA 1646]